MQLAKMKQKIRNHDFSPLYILYGSETFLMNELKQTIIDEAVDDSSKDFNFAQFDMAETPIQTALEDADTLPFIGEYRVIIIQHPIFLTGKRDTTGIDHDISLLEAYVKDPSPYTIMVFVADYEKLDNRKKLVKTMKTSGEVIELSAADEQMIIGILADRAAEQQVKLTDDAFQVLLQLVGPHLQYLISEVDKLALYAGDGGTITPDIVSLLTARTLESNVFALVDRVVHDRLGEAFDMLYDLLKQKEEPIKLLALIARQFRIIYAVKIMQKETGDRSQIARRLKLHPYAVKIAAGQTRAFNETQLLEVLQQCAEVDFQMKTGQMEQRLALELLLTKVHRPQELGVTS